MSDAARKTAWEPLGGCTLIIANLESPITTIERPAVRIPFLHRMPIEAVGIFDERFVPSLANNHIMDFGPAGLLDTMAALDDAGIAYAGAEPTLKRAGEPRIVQVGDTEIGVICAADPRFSPATSTSPGTCPAQTDLLVDRIRAVAGSAQVTVVSLHMGLEHVSIPSTAQIRLDGAEVREELAQLQRRSDRMLRGFPRQWSRLRELLSPGFLRANLHNYGFLLRGRGPRHVVKSLIDGVRAQFGSPHP